MFCWVPVKHCGEGDRNGIKRIRGDKAIVPKWLGRANVT